jgi:signal transduction histidine kinase
MSDVKNDTYFGRGLTGMKEYLIDFSGKVELLASKHGCSLKIKVEDCYD